MTRADSRAWRVPTLAGNVAVTVYLLLVWLWLVARGRLPAPPMLRILKARTAQPYSGPLTGLRRDEGSAYTGTIDADLESDSWGRSQVRLLEDGQVLGPAHAAHDDIRELGSGRYSHWDDDVHFSTSDNSDPRTNGRSYTVREDRLVNPVVLRASSGIRWAAARARTRGRGPYVAGIGAAQPEEGHCFIAPLPPSLQSDATGKSRLRVYEDDEALPQPHSPHRDIRELGAGRYSHWESELYFSASDNSDPRTNGRRYVVREAW